MKPARYLWLVHDATGTATRVHVLRLWRWRGEATTRRGVYVAPGYVTRVAVDYVGTRRTLTVWQPRTPGGEPARRAAPAGPRGPEHDAVLLGPLPLRRGERSP